MFVNFFNEEAAQLCLPLTDRKEVFLCAMWLSFLPPREFGSLDLLRLWFPLRFRINQIVLQPFELNLTKQVKSSWGGTLSLWVASFVLWSRWSCSGAGLPPGSSTPLSWPFVSFQCVSADNCMLVIDRPLNSIEPGFSVNFTIKENYPKSRLFAMWWEWSWGLWKPPSLWTL